MYCSSPRVCLAVVSIRPVFGRFWVRLPWANQILHVIVYVQCSYIYNVLTGTCTNQSFTFIIHESCYYGQFISSAELIYTAAKHTRQRNITQYILAPTGRRLGANFFLLFRFALFFVSTNFTICIQKTTLLTEVRMLHSFSCCEAFLCTK